MSTKEESGSPVVFTAPRIDFVGEQHGESENEFKRAVVRKCLQRRDVFVERAYLALVVYEGEQETSVALCLASEAQSDESVVGEIATLFRSMFGSQDHLDILYVSLEREVRLRKVCCPFYSAWRFAHPDFYWVSSDGARLNEVVKCYKDRRLSYLNSEGVLVCEIDPPLIGQAFGLGGSDVAKVVFVHRHRGFSLFPIVDWPAYVHVGRLICDIPHGVFSLRQSDVAFFQWGELYRTDDQTGTSGHTR